MASLTQDQLRKVIDHVFLPPKLPQSVDEENANIDSALLAAARGGLSDIKIFTPTGTHAAIDDALFLLSTLDTADETRILQTLRHLSDGQTMAVNVAAQNAAVLITRQVDLLIFEQFELSPDNHAVYSTKGRLRRTFPSAAVAVDSALLHQSDFDAMISTTLATMSHETVPEMQPVTMKKGVAHSEIRDTTRPAIVSELFFSMLRGIGRAHPTTSISKNTREEVLWNNTLLPWRRAPMWLLIRVATQLLMTRSPHGSHALYKMAITFIMRHILNAVQRHELPADLIYVMNAKIDQRLHKMLAVEPDICQLPVVLALRQTLEASNGGISRRWAEVQASDVRHIDLKALKRLKFKEDTDVALPLLDEHIHDLSERKHLESTGNFNPSSNLLHSDPVMFPSLPADVKDDLGPANLRQFECWVAQHGKSWTSKIGGDACKTLCQAIKRYHSLAVKLYMDNPEGMSVMLLTALELWIACDEAALATCPILHDYKDEVPVHVLQNLLLPTFDQMERLSRIEQYLGTRRGAKYRSQMLFDLSSDVSFASRFYDHSPAHQALRESIVSEAEEARSRKLAELKRVQTEYRRLDELHRQSHCEFVTKIIDDWCDPPETMQVHKSNCQKCLYKSRRDALSIDIFEWPLPARANRWKTVVFELDVPEWYAYWREARQYILNDVLKGQLTRTLLRAEYALSRNDPHLSVFRFRSPQLRIDLVSENKPAIVTHYRKKTCDVPNHTESTICVPNGLHYCYRDCTAGSYVGDFNFQDDFPLACTYKMPADAKTLQPFLFRPARSPDGEPPNAVIAGLDGCPHNMALDEYKELATLPLGRHLQWPNLMLQFAMPGIDFKKVETALCIFQCIYQTGPPSKVGNVLRESHALLLSRSEALRILELLHGALQRVKENWESAPALHIFVSVALRILSLNEAAKDAALNFLSLAREVAERWTQSLRDRAVQAVDHSLQTDLISRSVEVALICATTFDLDDKYLAEVLVSTEAASSLIKASIVVHEGSHSRASQKPHVAPLYLRFKRLLHRAYKILAQNQAGINAAIRHTWSAYLPGSVWSSISPQIDHWITATTAQSTGRNGLRVHLDLLSGELLVNGLPLNRPPKSYSEWRLYKLLFGTCSVEVMPSTSPGFQFSTNRQWNGYSVQLGMMNGDLKIQASNANGTFETIPIKLLEKKYPPHFLKDYVLWYRVADHKIDFRPVEQPWISADPASWILSATTSRLWTLTRDGTCVLGSDSRTAKAVSAIFEPLAAPDNIHCILQDDGNRLTVDIPSVQLGFFWDKKTSTLLSREYRPMAVDADQTLGTLIGFSNKLVLKSQTSNKRTVLILESNIRYQKCGNHVEAAVVAQANSKVHALEIDRSLQRLQDTGDISCKLYLAYLHALTSHCLPDPLIGRTGTEEALTILRSKAVESFESLSQDNLDLLAKISNLSPSRRFYPEHERVMQSVGWDNKISFMSQHGDFPAIVSSLLRIWGSYKLFSPEGEAKMPNLNQIDESLRERDLMRSSTFRVVGFGAEQHTTSCDMAYAARDQGIISPLACKVANISGIFFRQGLARDTSIASQDRLWQLMAAERIVYGASKKIKAALICYHANVLASGFQDAITMLPSLHNWLSNNHTRQKRRFSVGMWLSTLAYSKNADIGVLQILALMFKSTELVSIKAPPVDLFQISQGLTCSEYAIDGMVRSCTRVFQECPEVSWHRLVNERRDAWEHRRRRAWQTSRDAAVNRVVSALWPQWRCETPTKPDILEAETYIYMSGVMSQITDRFKILYDNRLLKDYVDKIQKAFNDQSSEPVLLPTLSLCAPALTQSLRGYVTQGDLFVAPAPSLPVNPRPLTTISDKESKPPHRVKEKLLSQLIEKIQLTFGQSQSQYEKEYVRDLKASLAALIQNGDNDASVQGTLAAEALALHLASCTTRVRNIYQAITSAMCSLPTVAGALEVQRLPRLTPVFLLRQLAHDRWHLLPTNWQLCIVAYALAVTSAQRAERLLLAAYTSRKEDLLNELRNVGHTNWDPLLCPESLLIEAEGGILIRPVQEDIAREMRSPSSGNNATLQLNMGEGKSSVIVPIVAASLADGTRLVRVITGRPQSKQMAQMLIAKIGGLVNRRVYYMPFSRSVRLTQSTAEALKDMLEECMKTGGVLLVQPEHILSFQLMALESYIDGRGDIGRVVMSTLDFLDSRARDIVDESDDNFSVKFELIYTMGTQQPMELSPDRWFLLQQVLDKMRTVIPAAVELFPDAFEITQGPVGSFNRVRVLHSAGGDHLIKLLAKSICDTGLRGFQLARQTSHVRAAVLTYITKYRLSEAEQRAVEESPMWANRTRSHLLVLRGLLACGVLLFTLSQKRWRVNYGLATRTPPTRLAVPYRAKDSPAPRSEFSHPDVVMVLTSLCYYYEGLCDDDLFAALGHLMNSDQADTEYQAWVQDSDSLPVAFRQLQGLNPKDKQQCIQDVFPLLRRGKAVVDYFLSHIVFPKDMKEFPHKLTASGWDLGKARAGEAGATLTTGFSGTSDARVLLPLDMVHLDLDQQRHTNALVLEYLLQPENSVQLMSPPAQNMTDAEHLLSTVLSLDPPVQVILDVGAQILELNSLEVAKAWLRAHPSESVEAVVFVDDEHNISVVDRQGRVDFLRTSSYLSRMGSCLVFLDEAHTRGIDLKLPVDFRAAVTLGAGISKDRLVQACMRMRKLGHGQTVVFCIPEEIKSKIRETVMKSATTDIKVVDVLAYAVMETHNEIRRCIPLWAVQGKRYAQQERLWKEARLVEGHTSLTQAHAQKFLEDEAQKIEARYLARQSFGANAEFSTSTEPKIQAIAERCRLFGALEFDSSVLEEEQERELSPEVEQERQVQRAPRARPAEHSLHPDVRYFAKTGHFIRDSVGYTSAFSLLQQTSARKHLPSHGILASSSDLQATRDYWTTIGEKKKLKHAFSSGNLDTFVRPVQWLLTHCDNNNTIDRVLILSPFEANELYEFMTTSTETALHLYKPRTNAGFASLDKLDFHTVSAHRPSPPPVFPRALAAQLNLFAGQIYLSTYKDYVETCGLLSLPTEALGQEEVVETVGAGDASVEGAPREVSLAKALLAIRRSGEDVSKTHLGALLDGQILRPEDFGQ